jgi:hypothetical protein
VITKTATGLSLTLSGLTECDQVCQDAWVAQMFTTTNDFFATSDSGLTILSNTPTITSTETTAGRRLQDGGAGVIINYDHTFRYTSDDDSFINVLDLAVQPLANDADREQFVADLKANGGFSFDDLSGVTAIDILVTPAPTASPTPAKEEDDELLSENAIIGIAVGGGVILLALIGCLCCRKKDNGQQDGGPPPDVLKVAPGRDEVSTLGGPEKPYGDQRYVVLVIAFEILVSEAHIFLTTFLFSFVVLLLSITIIPRHMAAVLIHLFPRPVARMVPTLKVCWILRMPLQLAVLLARLKMLIVARLAMSRKS